MTLHDFRQSLTAAKPPTGLTHALAAEVAAVVDRPQDIEDDEAMISSGGQRATRMRVRGSFVLGGAVTQQVQAIALYGCADGEHGAAGFADYLVGPSPSSFRSRGFVDVMKSQNDEVRIPSGRGPQDSFGD